ncbi:glycosyltransferase [Macellibacteroides fermentans]|uniref:glycosyltransferase n=1 Tax=Macellibacteroides fermentans TaxID=879969 RepID=UPI00406CA2EA
MKVVAFCDSEECKMKILMVNKFHYIKGGSETYYFALKRLLEERGHQVIDFSMQDEKNFLSEYSDYFVRNISYDGGTALTKAQAAMDIIYSFEAKRKFESLVLATKPDLIHLHIFQHQLSPSILDVIRKYKIPTVYTAHDLKMICLNYKMMHHSSICEECKGGKYYHCALNRCVKESFTKSCINVVEGYFHKLRKSYDVISTVITPSMFYKEKFEDFGVNGDRGVHIPNFLDRIKPTVNKTSDNKKYYLYFGRLSEEKGVFTLVKAFKNTSWNLYIVGTGPLATELEEYVKQNDISNVSFFGFQSGQKLIDFIGNAKAVILPSEWYENGPYSAIEALQMGRPIIGAQIGGIPELVDHNGFLFESGNADSLNEQIRKLEALNSKEYVEFEKASEQLFALTYSSEVHYQKLSEVYKKLVPEFK